MIICGAAEDDISAALSVANYAFYGNLVFCEEPKPLAKDHRSWSVLLGVKEPSGPGYRRGMLHYFNVYQTRPSKSVCYHAYREYLYALYEREPRAKVTTELAKYNSIEHFEASYRHTGSYDVGSVYMAVTFEEACDCRRRFPEIEELSPSAYLGKYALGTERSIYEGLKERKGGV